MKACSSGLNTHIQGGQTTLATLFKVTRRDGTVLGFTDHDVDLVLSGVTYLSTSSYNRFNLNEGSDASAKTTELVGAIDSVITRDDLERRLYDYATIQLLICNWESLSDGSMILATGAFGPVTIEEFQFRVEIRGMAKPLEDMGGEICGPGCRIDFGSAKCAPGGFLADGTDINSLLQTGTVTATDGVKSITFSGMTDPSKPDGGNLTFLSGSNANMSAEIKTINWGTNTLLLQPGALLLANIQIGDTFSYFPACDKIFFTCSTVYLNGLNFQGEPHAFNPDESLNYPDYFPPH
jgi:uncharacterized phage protein (TIGR02218 family)